MASQFKFQKLIFCQQMSNQIETEAVDPPEVIEKVSKDLEKKEVIEEESKLFPAFGPNKVFEDESNCQFLIILQPDGAAPDNKPVFQKQIPDFWLQMWKNADDLRKNKETPYNNSC